MVVGLGRKLRQARLEAGVESPERASALLGFGHSTVRDYEAERRSPGSESLRDMCRLYEADAQYLLGLPQWK